MTFMFFPYDWLVALTIVAAFAALLVRAVHKERKEKKQRIAILAFARRLVSEIETEIRNVKTLHTQTLAKIVFLRKYAQENGIRLKDVGTTEHQIARQCDRLKHIPVKPILYPPINESMIERVGGRSARGTAESLRPTRERELTEQDMIASAARTVTQP